MNIVERMDAALKKLAGHWSGKRTPKAFYLAEDDWADFMATNPPTGRFPWGNNPTIWVEDPTFSGVPVRASGGRTSRLYDNTTTGRALQ